MTESEFYTRLIESPCDGCSAYEEIGHCGEWSSNCIIFDLLMDLELNLLPFLGWDKETFLSYIFYKEDVEPELFWEEDELTKLLWDMSEEEYIHGMWDYEDEPFCYM